MDVQLVNGSFNDIVELRFITSEPTTARLINSKKRLLGGYRIVVDFDTVFFHGLQYMINQTIPVGGGIIGLSDEESKSLISFDVQRNLLTGLASMITPKHAGAILALARPAVHLIPIEANTKLESHLTGIPQLPTDTPYPRDAAGAPLFHLGTIIITELPAEVNLHHLKKYISFYLRTHLNGPWPYGQSDYAVMTYDEPVSLDESVAPFDELINIDLKPMLEIPRYDHSILEQFQFDEGEMEAYEALYSTYKSILDPMFDFHTYSKMGGYPDNVQICAAFEAEMLYNKSKHDEVLISEAIKWELLFQLIPEDDKFTFTQTFGYGNIFFMVRKDDLKKGDLSNVQLVIQNT